MITINDNSTNQINAAILRLNNNFTSANLELKNKLSSDVGRLELKIDEIKAGTLVYTAGSNISISSTGVISVTGLSTVATSGSYTDLTDKPTIPAPQVNADWNATSGLAEILNKPTIPAAQVQSDWAEADPNSKAYIQNKPALATVATSGSYNDLTDTPTIITPVQSDWTESDPTSLAYILNKPASQVVNDGATTLYQGNATSRHLFGSWSANQVAANNVYIDDGFTYIVDSDAALQTWQSGTAGYDYTSVLIKKGKWSMNLGLGSINLESCGTKFVYGEPGSLIYASFSGNATTSYYVMRQTNRPNVTNVQGGSSTIPSFVNKYDCWIYNVSIEIDDKATSNVSGILCGFYYLANLINCRVYAHRDASSGGKLTHYGFSYCDNLANCRAETKNARTNGRGFNYCRYLTNCESLSTAYSYANAFYGCYHLTSCSGVAQNLGTNSTAAYSTGFTSCNNLSGCYGYATYHSGSTLHGTGFYSCNYLDSCEGYGDAVGFSGCFYMSSCYGYSRDSSYPSIVNCRSVVGCRAYYGYNTSYADGGTSYPCADTPNGGFNHAG